ncbi:hypothetical protein H0H93_004586, partial [Arthromyces matolae]
DIAYRTRHGRTPRPRSSDDYIDNFRAFTVDVRASTDINLDDRFVVATANRLLLSVLHVVVEAVTAFHIYDTVLSLHLNLPHNHVVNIACTCRYYYVDPLCPFTHDIDITLNIGHHNTIILNDKLKLLHIHPIFHSVHSVLHLAPGTTVVPMPTPSSTTPSSTSRPPMPSSLRFAKRALPTPSSTPSSSATRSSTPPFTPTPSATRLSTRPFTQAQPHTTTTLALVPLPTPPHTQMAAGTETGAPPLFHPSPPPSSPPSDASFGPWDPVDVEVNDSQTEAMDNNAANNEPDELDAFFYSQVDDSREGLEKDNSTHSSRKRSLPDRNPIASNKRRKVRKVCLTLGAGGGNGGGVNGGVDPAHYWDPDCHRNGDRLLARTGDIPIARAARDAMDDILHRDPDAIDDDFRMEDQEDAQDGDYVEGGQAEGGEGGEEDASSKAAKSPKRKPRQRTMDKLAWKENGIPPPTTRRAQIALASLCTIWTSSNRAVLSSFLTQLGGHQHTTPPTILSSSTTVTSDSIFPLLETLMNHCDELTVDRALTDYKLMVAEFQLFSVVDTIQTITKLSTDEVAKRIGCSRNALWERKSRGNRIAYLVASATPHILPVLACTSLRVSITRRAHLDSPDVYSMGFALRHPQDDEAGSLVKNHILPFIRCMKGVWLPPLPIATLSEEKEIQILDLVTMTTPERDVVLGRLNTNFFPLPDRSDVWDLLDVADFDDVLHQVAPLPRVIAGPDVIHVKMVKTYTNLPTPLPRPKQERRQWTRQQRIKANDGTNVSSLEELKELLEDPQKGDEYVRFNSRLCEDKKTILIRDGSDQLLALLITHFLRQFSNYNKRLMEFLKNVFPNELFDDEYCEKGDGAPQNVNPAFLCRSYCKRGHHGQRCPWASKEIKNQLEQYDLLAEFLQDLFAFVRDQMSELLPKEYDEIKIYVEELPHNVSSPAHPFGGFVVNFCVATEGHRDARDLLLCVVIPFGQFEG